MVYTIVFIIIVVAYIVGVIISCYNDTTEVKIPDVERTTIGHRNLTPRDIRIGVIWPLRLLMYLMCITVLGLHEALKIFFLVFSFKYGDTNMYKVTSWHILSVIQWISR